MSANHIGVLRVDAPVESWPAIENAAAMIQIVDRRHRFGMKMLRRLLGRAHLKSALAMRGRWLVAIARRCGVVVFDATSEEALLQVHRDVIELSPRVPGHLEVVHFIDRELRARIVADSQAHSLLITPCEGRA